MYALEWRQGLKLASVGQLVSTREGLVVMLLRLAVVIDLLDSVGMRLMSCILRLLMAASMWLQMRLADSEASTVLVL